MSTVRPQVGRPMKLRSFRLDQIPLAVRRRAATTFRRVAADDLQPERFGGTRLYGRAASTGERVAALDTAIEVTRKALFPTGKSYRVSDEAWLEMVERAEARSRGSW